MSQVGTSAPVVNTAPVAAAVASATPELTPEQKAYAEFKATLTGKKGKLVLRGFGTTAPQAEQDAFAALVKELQADETEKVVDWTTKVAEDMQAHFSTMALVKVDNTGDYRLIGMADQATAMADATVSAYMYRLYVNKIANHAGDDDAQEAEFIIPSGCFKQKLDVEAFKFVAKDFVKTLHKGGLVGITVGGLKQAFANAAFAETQFSRIKADNWGKLLGIAIALSEKAGYDPSIFNYWLATREGRVDEGEEIDLNFDTFAVSVADEHAEAQADEETATAPTVAAPATPVVAATPTA